MSVITSDWCGASSALALCPASRFQIEFAARCTLLTLLYFCRDLPLGLEFLGCGGGGEISYGCSLQRVSFELLPWQLLLQLLLLLHVAAAGVGCPKPFALTSLGSRIVEQHQVDFRPSLPPWRKLSLKYCTQAAKKRARCNSVACRWRGEVVTGWQRGIKSATISRQPLGGKFLHLWEAAAAQRQLHTASVLRPESCALCPLAGARLSSIFPVASS